MALKRQIIPVSDQNLSLGNQTQGKAPDLDEELAIISLIESLVERAYTVRASDIHFDPEGDRVKVRFRIDGVLQDIRELSKKSHEEVITRIKVLSRLRTDQHQTPQDGRFRCLVDEGPIDVRVSIMPTYYGENAVLRLLADTEAEFSFANLGFSPENQQKLVAAIKRPYGMILVTGPTGSGKTTTLYTIIKQLNSRDTSIITIEDPIEYSLAGINQIQANPATGLTFATGLRSILRQDPNIIMVGEIRDSETAGLAVNTALTGHLLLSTLHTNDAATTLPRLLDMGVENYLIASTVNLAIGQRLVRKICVSCKTAHKLTVAERKSFEGIFPDEYLAKNAKYFEGKGCEDCSGTGYKGRIGIQELIVVDNQIREAILKKVAADEMRRIAIGSGMVPMFEDGLKKALDGTTTLSEVLRMLHD